jgi:hypothetical protein
LAWEILASDGAPIGQRSYLSLEGSKEHLGIAAWLRGFIGPVPSATLDKNRRDPARTNNMHEGLDNPE